MMVMLVLLILVVTAELEGMAAVLPLPAVRDTTAIASGRHSSTSPDSSHSPMMYECDRPLHKNPPAAARAPHHGKYLIPDAEMGRLMEARLGMGRGRR